MATAETHGGRQHREPARGARATSRVSEVRIVERKVDEPVVPAEATAVGRKPRSTARAVPKCEADSRERVRTAVRRFNKPLMDLVSRDANEGDTRLLVTDLLCDGLGYDKYEDLTTEYQVKWTS